MVAPTWDLMSSPMIGSRRSSNRLRHGVARGDEDRDAVDEGAAGLERLLGVPLGRRLLRADRQVADQHVGPGLAQRTGDVVGGRASDSSTVPLQVPAEPVERRAAAAPSTPERRHVGEADSVVGRRLDRLGQVAADLAGVDVERGRELDVADVVAAQLDVHQARHGGVRRGVPVEVTPWTSEEAQLPTPAIATFTVLRAIPPLPRAAPGPPTRASTKRNTRAAVGFR